MLLRRSSPCGPAATCQRWRGGPSSGLCNIHTTGLLRLTTQSCIVLIPVRSHHGTFRAPLQKQPTFVELSEAGIGKGARCKYYGSAVTLSCASSSHGWGALPRRPHRNKSLLGQPRV